MTRRPAPAPNSVRVFAALELPDAVVHRLAAVMMALRAAVPARSVRWARPEGLHLTLQFYGEVDRERVPALETALAAAAAGAEPLTLNLAGLGAFPTAARARVVWVGVAGDLERLRALQAAVEAGGRPLGFQPDERGFHPHLTLGRVNGPLPPTEQHRLADALARIRPPAGSVFTLDALSLMRSEPQGGGSVYTRLWAAPLSGGRKP
ncbi:MAG: RNA 2',3'-cyclic phosphodiesterase [Anaerolineales bacterium]|nr:RNA 2',3'-cyclic phosphodiesterase [Anaerolineales bacterium]